VGDAAVSRIMPVINGLTMPAQLPAAISTASAPARFSAGAISATIGSVTAFTVTENP
jgi:hypothetical protein